jgi:hypothetical protein
VRTKHCVICGSPLPEGVRIDRRYCREACRVMAYRQRRKPDSLSVPASPDEDANPSEQASAASTSSARDTHTPADLATAIDRIADLESQCRALRQRATSLELQHEATQRRMAAMELALRRMRAVGSESAAKHDATRDSPSNAEKKPGASSEIPSIELLPWMMPSQDDLSGQVPKWTLLQDDFMTDLDSRIDHFMASLPEGLVALGLSSHAVQIRQWQRSDVRTFRRMARAIARRIICTDQAVRKSDAQLQDLALLMIESLSVPHPSEDIGDRAAWEQLLAEGSQTLALVTAFLIKRFQDSDWMTRTR